MAATSTVLVAVLLLVAGCGITGAVNNAVDQAVGQIESALKVIQQESAAWRNELPQLQAGLDSLVARQQGQATADVRQVLADTSNDVRALADDTVKLAGLTAEQLIARFGAEARCSLDFARSRVTASLSELVSRLKFWQTSEPHSLPPPAPHSVCQVTPDNVELRSTGVGGGWTLTQPADKIVGIYGYDFRPEALPAVDLADLNGAKLRDTAVSVTYVTRYQINANFAAEGFDQVGPTSRYVLRWPDRPEPNAVSVTLIQPARLKILGVDVQPATARARVDLVRPVVDVQNQGGSDTNRFEIRWRPGPDDPVQSIGVDNLGPGERRPLTFPGYVYQRAGTPQTDIVVGDGSDSWHGTVNVTPYANTPHLQSVPIRGEWPGGGGERGEPPRSDFGLPSITLGPDCELDTSRGGGSFDVADIDNETVKYLIAWPSGYDFGFGGNTFWRSFSSLSASYDQQARTVVPVVTLKGLGGHGGIFATRGPERFDGSFTVYSLCPS